MKRRQIAKFFDGICTIVLDTTVKYNRFRVYHNYDVNGVYHHKMIAKYADFKSCLQYVMDMLPENTEV